MTRPLRIALFGLKGFPARGGTASVGEQLVRHYGEGAYFTVYATSSHASDKQPYSNARQLIIRKFLPHRLNVFYYNLIGALHALFFGNYDVVHTHQIDTGYIVPLLRLRYKVVSTHHGRTYQMSKWGGVMKCFFKVTEWLMVKFANQVTFVADTERLAAEEKYGGSYLTINNGVDLEQKVSDTIAEMDYLMFAAGRIIPHKGCHVFLEALVQMQYKGLVIIAGDHKQLTGYQSQLEGYANELKIRFVGMLSDKEELLGYVKNARLFVFPSFYEAMSMMLLEVAAVKTPLICSDIPENKSVFSDEEVTYFKTGDVDDLKKKIIAHLNNEAPGLAKAELAFNRLSGHYHWTKLAQQYADVYISLAQKHQK